jgi:hypothetical protein
VGLVLLSDFLRIAELGLVDALWAPIDAGGIGHGRSDQPACLLYALLGASQTSALVLLVLACASASTLALGLYSRTSALALLFVSTQVAQLSPDADRGIDMLLRNVLIVLACSGAGATWSIDAWRKQGCFSSNARIRAWPRYLLILQLSLLYFGAGMLKQSPAWSAAGGYSALYQVLNKPEYASFAIPYPVLRAGYPLLQLGTLVSLSFERAAIFLPLLVWCRATATPARKLRWRVRSWRLLELWIATGVVFHLGLAVSVDLGIFPWGCLALYPVLRDSRAWKYHWNAAAG